MKKKPDKMRLLRTVLYLHHKLERASRELDISISQYRMLYFLKRGSQRAADLATASSIRKPSITSLLNTLDTRGLIRRENDPSDRRAVTIHITDEGVASMRAFEAGLQKTLQELLGEDAVAQADETLTAIYDLWDAQRRERYDAWMKSPPETGQTNA